MTHVLDDLTPLQEVNHIRMLETVQEFLIRSVKKDLSDNKYRELTELHYKEGLVEKQA